MLAAVILATGCGDDDDTGTPSAAGTAGKAGGAGSGGRAGQGGTSQAGAGQGGAGQSGTGGQSVAGQSGSGGQGGAGQSGSGGQGGAGQGGAGQGGQAGAGQGGAGQSGAGQGGAGQSGSGQGGAGQGGAGQAGLGGTGGAGQGGAGQGGAGQGGAGQAGLGGTGGAGQGGAGQGGAGQGGAGQGGAGQGGAGQGGAGQGGAGQGGGFTFDPTFGDQGVVELDTAPESFTTISDLALGPDGTILASGGRGAGALRLLADGALDLSFGDSGFSALGPADLVSRAIARQADGKAVVAGFQTELESVGDLSFVRLNVDGALDPSFGAGGVLTIEVPGGAGIFDLAVQDDGKIVAAGEGQPRLNANCPMLARLTPSGALDPSFAGGGLTFYQAPSPGPDVLFGRARAVFLSPDSSFWAVGDGVSLENQGGFQTIDLLLLRYRPDGTLDPTSGVNGATYVDYAAPPVEGAPNDRDNFALSVARGDDGRLVTGGEVYDLFNPTTNRGVVTRHLADGRIDPSFGESGVFVIPQLSRIFGVTVLADDSVMAIGFRLNNEGTAFVDFALHLLADGTPDAAFGVDGQLDLGAGFFADSVARQADGKVLIGGSRAIEGGGSHPFFMRLQR